MGRGKKVTKKSLALPTAARRARGTGVDGSTGEFAVEAMRPQGLPTGAAGGSGEGITSAEATGPPALSMLDDEILCLRLMRSFGVFFVQGLH